MNPNVAMIIAGSGLLLWTMTRKTPPARASGSAATADQVGEILVVQLAADYGFAEASYTSLPGTHWEKFTGDFGHVGEPVRDDATGERWVMVPNGF